MKFCPYCLTEHDGSEIECIFCGNKYPQRKPAFQEETPYIGEYNVVITNIYDKKAVIKAIQEGLDCDTEIAEAFCEKGIIENIPKEDALAVVKKMRQAMEFAHLERAQKVEKLIDATDENKEETPIEPENKVWSIVLMSYGENREEAVQYLKKYYGWNRKVIDKLLKKVGGTGRTIMVVDTREEAEEIILDMQEKGLKVKWAEMDVEEYKKRRKYARRLTNRLVAMLIVLGVYLLAMIGIIIVFSII